MWGDVLDIKIRMSNKNLYSIILPTYNERENLPIITHILEGVR